MCMHEHAGHVNRRALGKHHILDTSVHTAALEYSLYVVVSVGRFANPYVAPLKIEYRVIQKP